MEPEQQEIIRNPDGTFPKGVSGNPAGRPKGETLKEYWRRRFKEMTDEEKAEFTKKVGLDTVWKMAEGNPHITSETAINANLSISFHDTFKDADTSQETRGDN